VHVQGQALLHTHRDRGPYLRTTGLPLRTVQPSRMAYSTNTLFAALVGAFLFTACSSDTPNSNGPSAMPALPPSNATSPSGAANDGTNASIRLNPPHGEPGHVCEIPVGEPLDGSGAVGSDAGATQNIQMGTGMNMAPQTMTIPSTQGTPTQGGGSGRINPPHGEPGHVCEVPVGEPLP